MRANTAIALAGLFLEVARAAPAVGDIEFKKSITYPKAVHHMDAANTLIAQVTTERPRRWLNTLTDFWSRHYRTPTGKAAAEWLFREVRSVASVNPSIIVKQFNHSFDQPSVIAQIPGRNPEIVILGAHFDSTAYFPPLRSPGADDNASGTVCVLEVLRVLAEAGFKPNNTLEFHWYAAEEAERAGSHDVFKHYEAVGKRVVAMLNQDMTGYSPSDAMSIVINGVDPALTEYVEVVATAYSDKPPTKTECPRDDCSDHSSAIQYGFPAAFVFEDQYDKSNPWIHSSNDTPDKIQWKAVLRHARFSVGFVVEASYLNPRLADGKGQKPKPVQPTEDPQPTTKLPWISERMFPSLCGQVTYEEETCGTQIYCAAFDSDRAIGKLPSTFRSAKECFEAHEPAPRLPWIERPSQVRPDTCEEGSVSDECPLTCGIYGNYEEELCGTEAYCDAFDSVEDKPVGFENSKACFDAHEPKP